MNCELCTPENELLLWQNGLCRIVLVEDANYPGFCRVIWNRHVKEMTDLAEDERQDFMQVVFAVESVVRKVMHPDKINLASLGNMTPHLHWHVIPRYISDMHYPNPIWSSPQRAGMPAAPPDWRANLARQLNQIQLYQKAFSCHENSGNGQK